MSWLQTTIASWTAAETIAKIASGAVLTLLVVWAMKGCDKPLGQTKFIAIASDQQPDTVTVRDTIVKIPKPIVREHDVVYEFNSGMWDLKITSPEPIEITSIELAARHIFDTTTVYDTTFIYQDRPVDASVGVFGAVTPLGTAQAARFGAEASLRYEQFALRVSPQIVVRADAKPFLGVEVGGIYQF